MAQRKNSRSSRKSSTRKTSYKRNNSRRAKEQDMELKQDIKVILLIAVAIFVFICNFGVIGKFGDILSDFLFGVFGIMNYVFALFAAALIIYTEAVGRASYAVKKDVALCTLFLIADMVVDLVSGVSRNLKSFDLKTIYQFSANDHVGGGVIASSINYLLCKLINVPGTIICIVVLFLISAILLTGKSFVKTVGATTRQLKEQTSENRQLKEAIYEDRRTEALRRREEAARKREEMEEKREEKRLRAEEERSVREAENRVRKEDKRLKKETLKQSKEDDRVLKENKKVTGVTFNTDLSNGNSNLNSSVPQKENVNDDIHEINLNNFNPGNLTYKKNDTAINHADKDYDPAFSVTSEEEVYVYEEVKPALEKKPETLNVARIKESPKKEDSIPDAASIKSEIAVTGSSDASTYKFPPKDLLKKAPRSSSGYSGSLDETGRKLMNTLSTYGVEATLVGHTEGPTVTRFEIQPKTGVKVSRIVNLSDEIKLNLAASEIRIEAPIPGKAAIGIEIPNKEPQSVFFRELIESDRYEKFDSNLAFAIGKDIEGRPVVYGIDDFPHLLIAGSTGSGKSVCINTLIMSIIYKANPDDVKLIMIDPKVVELSVYNGIPHLLLDVVTDVKKAAATLRFAVNEMQERYKLFADFGVREIKGYNRKVEENGEDAFHKKIPHIVVIVDELAELMIQEKKNVEESIVSLTQLARAAGIHLIIATQRPSVDVITGLIKANMPSRIAFAVTSNVDSRTILDMGGAEELLGKGDMLFFPKGLKKPVRLQGGFISDKEIGDVVDFIKKQGHSTDSSGVEEKINALEKKSDSSGSKTGSSDEAVDGNDELFAMAGKLVVETNKASIGNIQRKFKVGFNRAARIMDQLTDAGVVGPDQGTKPREVLMSPEQFENYLEEYGG